MRVARDVQSRWFSDGRIPMRTRLIHGYRRSFLVSGDGPPLLLIHGIGDSSEAWREVIPMLARNHLVIAPDLLGHGTSDKPRADYSVAAYANGMRDLLTVLGIDRVTLVGHSLGGGVALQFAYQYPARVDRLVLVSSGGAGRSVTPFLRAASIPGSHLALAGLRAPFAGAAVRAAFEVLRRLDTGIGIDAVDAMRVISALPDRTARAAFVRTLRSAVDWKGQVVTMLDRAYLARTMPTMIVWGAKDSVLPVGHARRVHNAMPGSRLEIFANAAHFPFRTDPRRFVDLIEEFCESTPPHQYELDEWRQVLRAGYAETIAPDYAHTIRGELRHESERSAT